MAMVVFVAFLVSTLVVCHVFASGDCFASTAAFTLRGFTYLVDGNNYIALDHELKESYKGTMKEAFGVDGDIKAAGVWTSRSRRYPFFNVANEILEYSIYTQTATKTDQDWGSFFGNDLDAASKLGGSNYYFKHCTYTKDLIANEYYLMDLGIPVCDVDAAFTHYGDMFIIKGKEYWVVGQDMVIQGPNLLKDRVTLTSTGLCEPTYEDKVNAERKYERENKCVIIDAAFAIDNYNTLYLFNDEEAVAFDNFTEEHKMPISEWGIHTDRIDAATVMPKSCALKMFRGPYFYRYSKNISYGTRVASSFLESIDAAGNVQDEAYFFKHCQVATDSSEPMNLVDLGMPCDMDAAYSYRGVMYVIKGNRVWTWKGGDDKASSPYPLENFIKIKSLTLCP